MEQTVKFSVFKEKIIKTNELLQLHLEKTRELAKTQKCYQELKAKLELSKREIEKLKLKHDTTSYNLQQSDKKYKIIQEEHEKLKEKYNQLEKESGDTINNLQINYQLTSQELKDCNEKLSHFQEKEPPVIVKSPVKRKKRVIVEYLDPCDNQDINKLSAENKKLVSENNNLKLEIKKLKETFVELDLSKNSFNKIKQLETELSNKKQELLDLKNHLFTVERSKNEEINELMKKISEFDKNRKKLIMERDALKEENCSYKLEISLLQEQNENNEINEVINTEITVLCDKVEENHNKDLPIFDDAHENSNTPTNEHIADIMKEFTITEPLSPLAALTEEDYMLSLHKSPVQLSHDLIHFKRQEIDLFKQKLVTSSSGNFTISNYSDMIRNSNKIKRKKKKKISKRKAKKIDLYETLLALKKAKINFVISNDSFLEVDRVSSRFLRNQYPPPVQIQSEVQVPEKKYSSNNVISKLNCNLECCKNCHMLLKGSENVNAPLLGFFYVKDEIQSPLDTLDNINEKINRPKMIPSHRSMRKRKKPKENVKDPCITLDSENITEISDDSGSFTKDNAFESCIISKKNEKPDLKRRKAKSINPSSVINSRNIVHSYSTRTNMHKLNQSSLNKENDSRNPVKKRIAHVPNNLKPSETSAKSKETMPIIKPKSPKTTFKRPTCRTRRSPRLTCAEIQEDDREIAEKLEEHLIDDGSSNCPQSPTPEDEVRINNKPKIIPLERVSERVEKMPTSKIEVLFVKLINYSMEEETLNEIVREFSNQDPEYIAQAILEKISQDFHDPPDTKYNPAPLMTETQRIMLGFMSKLEKTSVIGVFDSFLALSEHRLLTCPVLQEIAPITRLYLAICKLQMDINRMRKLCCDVFYFCGDFGVPFLFFVLTSWSEVLPHAVNSQNMPLAKVLVQVVYLKDCNKPGYNLMPLRDLLIKFYGYPTERWDSNELFEELLQNYLKNPVRSSDFALILLCKNHSEKWVYEKIEQHLKPLIDKIPTENFKAAVIILIGNLYNRFSSKSEPNYLLNIRKWLTNLVTETTPDVVKRSVYLCLNRLAKK